MVGSPVNCCKQIFGYVDWRDPMETRSYLQRLPSTTTENAPCLLGQSDFIGDLGRVSPRRAFPRKDHPLGRSAVPSTIPARS